MMTSPSPSSTEFGSRGSPSTFGDDDFAFTLIDRVRLDGLVVYFGNRNFAFALVDRVRLEGFAFFFGDDDFGLRSCQQSSTRGARLCLR